MALTAVPAATPAAAGGWTPPGPVGDAPRSGRPVLDVTGPASGPRAQTTPAPSDIPPVPVPVTCRPMQGFSTVSKGPLYRMLDPDPAGISRSFRETGQVGSGWLPGTFMWTGGAGSGVFYTLNWAGELKWYGYNSARSGWKTGSGAVVGRGFLPSLRVINIAVGRGGDLYVVRTDGRMYLYRHTGFETGAPTWQFPSGKLIGSGWGWMDDEIIVPGGHGVLYRQFRGSLYWYRHSDPSVGALTWSPRTRMGSGWEFFDLASAGAGVLIATNGTSGELLMYRHGDPLGGRAVWAVGHAVSKGTLRTLAYGVVVDADACDLAT